MIIFVDISEEGNLLSWGSSPISPFSIELEIPDDHPMLTDDFHNYNSYRYVDGELIKDEELLLKSLKFAKKEIVNLNVRKACTKGFTSPTTGRTYETDTHDQENFSRRWQVVSTFPSKYTSVPWKTADGKIIEHTVEDFITLCGEIDDFITETINKGWVIKAQIDQAQSLQELEKISLEVE